MAKVLDNWQASDGLDVRCALDDGRTLTFHWHGLTEEPKGLQELVDAHEARVLASEAAGVAAEVETVSEIEGLRAELADVKALLVEKSVALEAVRAELAVAVGVVAQEPVGEVKP